MFKITQHQKQCILAYPSPSKNSLSKASIVHFFKYRILINYFLRKLYTLRFCNGISFHDSKSWNINVYPNAMFPLLKSKLVSNLLYSNFKSIHDNNYLSFLNLRRISILYVINASIQYCIKGYKIHMLLDVRSISTLKQAYHLVIYVNMGVTVAKCCHKFHCILVIHLKPSLDLAMDSIRYQGQPFEQRQVFLNQQLRTWLYI